MTFWIVAFVMSAAVAALMLLALRRGGEESRAAEADMQVYRDQLREVERDLGRGVLSEAEAATIRVEVSRRLLEADRQVSVAAGGREAPGAATGAMAALTAAAVVGGTIALYQWLGAPGYPDLPLATRIEMAEAARANRPDQSAAEAEAAGMAGPGVEASAEYLALMERLRTTVAERPDDVQGQRLLARNEAALGNYAAARAAQDRVVAILGETATAQDLADQADLMVMAAGGYVSPQAEAVLARALERDPQNGAARYYSGLLMAQTGRADLAFQLWDGLLRQSAPTDPWVPPIRAQIRDVAEIAGVMNYEPQIGPGRTGANGGAGRGRGRDERRGAGRNDPQHGRGALGPARHGRRAARGLGAADRGAGGAGQHRAGGGDRGRGGAGLRRERCGAVADRRGADAGGARLIAPDMAAFAGALPRIGAVMGLDFGEKTIGVAVSDRMRSVASPLETVRRTKFTVDAARLLEIAGAREIAGLVIGLPLNMDGSEGPRCQSTRAFARNSSG
jgi:cytochrome c-type biogenesis protein CcmH